MENEIDIPKVPLSRTEQYLTKIVKELSGSDEEVEIPKTTLSRVEMYLKAIIDLLAEAAVKKPITVKGTVDSKDQLPQSAAIGDMYFVRKDNKSEEFIFTDHGWDPVGDTSVDLSDYITVDQIKQPLTNKFDAVDDEISQLQADQVDIENEKLDKIEANSTYATSASVSAIAPSIMSSVSRDFVKKSDYATSSSAGIVTVPDGCGLKNFGSSVIGIDHVDAEKIETLNDKKLQSYALTLDRVPQVVDYYVDGKSLEMDADTHTVQIHHPDASEIEAAEDLEHQALTLDRISGMFNYFGIDDKTTLDDDYVKNTDYATVELAGAVKVANDADTGSDDVLIKKHTGICIQNNGTLHLTETEATDIDEEKEGRLALHPNDIPHIMKNYGLDSKTYLGNTYATKEELENICVKRYDMNGKLSTFRRGTIALNMVPQTATVININAVFTANKNSSGVQYPLSNMIVIPIQTNRLSCSFPFITVLPFNIQTATFITDDTYNNEDITITVWYIDNLPFVES